MDKMDKKELAAGLARRLAHRGVSDAQVKRIAEELVKRPVFPIGIDVCTQGQCQDFLVDKSDLVKLVDSLHRERDLGSIRIFPKGIIDPDRFLVRATHILELLPR